MRTFLNICLSLINNTLSHGTTLFGAVNNVSANREAGAVDLHSAVYTAFQQSNLLIATFGGSTLPVICSNDHFHIF